MSSATGTSTQTCYRHPTRETGVNCSACGRPICPDCMTPTPVGMRCPECARQRTPVRTMRNIGSEPRVTVGIIAICVLAFLATGSFGPGGGGGDTLFRKLALFGPSVADGDYWRLVTSGFLHAGILHIAFNMYLLWILGQLLEPALGSRRFAALYAASLLAGSFGALLVEPNALTVGASGAIFGLMGAAAVELRARGANILQTDIGLLIIFNLGLSFVLSNISVGGHIGGLVGGVLVGLAFQASERRGLPWLSYAGAAVVAAAAAVGAVAVA
jgi:membrane associated rhomboid family serine protease